MITIRPEKLGDEEQIRNVNVQAFGRDAEARLIELLRGSRFYVEGLSLVAEQDNQIIGHIMLSMAMLISNQEVMPILALAPMAVLPEYQNQGVGTRLVKTGLKRAENSKFPAVVVLGHPEYYPRFGFVRASEKGVYAPFGAPDEVYMVMELTPNALANITGTVRYPPCFDDI